MPLMPRRPSKKAQKIAEDLNPLLKSANIPMKREARSNNEELRRRDMIQNFRAPEPNR